MDGTTGMSPDGQTVYRGTATGAWAERVVVSSQVALPTGGVVPLRDAALLGCAALTGAGAVLFPWFLGDRCQRCWTSTT